MFTLKYIFNNFFLKSKSDFDFIQTSNIDNTFKKIEDKFNSGAPFYFVRFGDGEFLTLMKKNHRNYLYNKGLETELDASFRIKDDNYLLACPINYPYDKYITKGIYKRFSWQDEMIKTLKERGIQSKSTLENPCVFQCLSVFYPKKIKLFLNEHIRPKTKMFIGSTPKKTAELLYGKIDCYVNIPKQHAYESIDTWWPEVERNIKNVDLIIPSAGSTSNVISVRLWDLNYRKYVIDFGSIVDAAEQIQTRTWIRLAGHRVLNILDPKPKLTFNEKLKNFKKEIKFVVRNQFI